MVFETPQEISNLLAWLRQVSKGNNIKERSLDFLATSMRNFDDVSSHLEDIETHTPPNHSDPRQRLTDLRHAKLLNPHNDTLSPLGQSVLNQWRHFGIANNSIQDELARHIVLVIEAKSHNDDGYAKLFSYWLELRKSYPASELIDNWDNLFVLNYLDYERNGYAPGNDLRSSGVPLSEVNLSLEEVVEKNSPNDADALSGAERIERTIKGKVPRGRHRATFCLAMELTINSRADAEKLIDNFGIPKTPRVWIKLPTANRQKVLTVLDSYSQNIAVPTSSPKDERPGVDGQALPLILPDNIDYNRVRVEPPEAKKRNNLVRPVQEVVRKKIDYQAKAARDSASGRKGEEFILQYERHKLVSLPRLADKVEWVSEYTDSLGYDIKSFDVDGSPIYIEVKSTTGEANEDFFITAYELETALKMKEQYKIYRVFNLSSDPKFFEIPSPITDSIDLVPVAFSAKLKAKV